MVLEEDLVFVEPRTIMDGVDIPKEEQELLKKLGCELIHNIDFFINPKEMEKVNSHSDYLDARTRAITLFYLNRSDIRKHVNICPHNSRDRIEEITLDEVKNLQATSGYVKFDYKDIKVSVDFEHYNVTALRFLKLLSSLKE